jgi:hypothetical protein
MRSSPFYEFASRSENRCSSESNYESLDGPVRKQEKRPGFARCLNDDRRVVAATRDAASP